jgi:octanoyl-[GcvH]:protein N-octanoyltransferase
MRVFTDTHPEDPALDMALSQVLLRRIARGQEGPLARVYRPGATAAFGKLDTLSVGYPAARMAAERHGFTPVVRLGGGRAAVYDGGSVVVELMTREERVAEGTTARFEAGTQTLAAALRSVGIEVKIGQLPGEYCPGRWSLHIAGGPKIAGAAQRSIRGASLFAAIVVVTDGARVRDALIDIYAALDLEWDPTTAGCASDRLPELTADLVAAAMIDALGEVSDLALATEVLEEARALTAALSSEPPDGRNPRR